VADKPKRVYLNDVVRGVLKDVAAQFIEFGFSELMASVKEDLLKDVAGVMQDDYTNFMHLAGFLMEFHRVKQRKEFKEKRRAEVSAARRAAETAAREQAEAAYAAQQSDTNGDAATAAAAAAAADAAGKAAGKAAAKAEAAKAEYYYDPTNVNCTLDNKTFKFLTTKCEEYQASKPPKWSSLEPSVSIYKEFMRGLYEMTVHGKDAEMRADGQNRRFAALYERESIDLAFVLVREYEPSRNTRTYLNNVVTTVHFLMKNLSQLGKANHYIVTRRRRITKKRIKKDGSGKKKPRDAPSYLRAPQVEIITATETATADAGADGATSPTKAAGDGDTSFSTPKPSRRIVDDDDDDDDDDDGSGNGAEGGSGASSAPVVADEGAAVDAVASNTAATNEDDDDEGIEDDTVTAAAAAAAAGDGAVEYEEYEAEEEVVDPEAEERAKYRMIESQLEMGKIIMRYAHPKVVRNYCYALQQYKTNTAETNAMIMRLFQRLAFERHLEPMFFQLVRTAVPTTFFFRLPISFRVVRAHIHLHYFYRLCSFILHLSAHLYSPSCSCSKGFFLMRRSRKIRRSMRCAASARRLRPSSSSWQRRNRWWVAWYSLMNSAAVPLTPTSFVATVDITVVRCLFA
jgi:hypothetical protein